jgi:hypothetical protein
MQYTKTAWPWTTYLPPREVYVESSILEEITDRMRKSAYVLSRLGEDGIPKTCLEVGSLPWADSRP